jgi:MFS family permease
MIYRKTLVVLILTFVAKMSYGVILPTLSVYASSLGASHSFIGLIVSIYALVQLFTQVPIGRASDRFGRRYLVVGGFVGLAAAAELHSYATRPDQFLLLQGLAGLATGSLWAPLMALLTEDSSPSQRGKLMGVFNTIFFVGLGLGPLLGGYIASYFGNTAPFHVWAIASAASGLFSLIAIKDLPTRDQTPGVAKDRSFGNPSRFMKPGLWPTFAAGCVIRGRGGVCTSFNNTMLPLYAVMLFDASPRMIGSLMFSHGLMIALFNLPGGMMSDRFGRKLPALLGSLVASAGVFWYSFPSGFWALLIAVGLAGAGAAFTQSSVAALTADVCNPQRRGEAFGYLLTAHNTGMVFGALSFGFVSDLVGLPGAVLTWAIVSLVLSLFGFMIYDAEARQQTQAVYQESWQDSAR